MTQWTAVRQASLSFTISRSLLQLKSIKPVMPSNHLILCRPLLLLTSTFPSIRVFLDESALCIRWPKYWSFSFSISPCSEYSGLISFRMDWLNLFSNLFFFFFLLKSFDHATWPVSILVCRPGIEPVTSVLEIQSLHHWSQGSPTLAVLKVSCLPLSQSVGGCFRIGMSRPIAAVMSTCSALPRPRPGKCSGCSLQHQVFRLWALLHGGHGSCRADSVSDEAGRCLKATLS